MRFAVDARVAAEVPAGRGRYVRELLRHLPAVAGDHEVRLLGRTAWRDPAVDADPRLRWMTLRGGERSWPVSAAYGARGADAVLATASYLLCGLTRVPVVPVVYDLAPFDRRFGTPPGAALERLTLPPAVRRAARIVCISAATRDALLARHPGAAPRIEIVTPAAGPGFKADPDPGDEAIRRRHGLEGPYVLAVGTLEPRKNLARLVEAFSALDPAIRGDVRLALAGGVGWGSGLPDADPAVVRRLGFVADGELPAIYRGATAFAYPSLQEGFGIPVLEALQSGVPVLTSDVSSLPEVAGDVAVYAAPEDVRAIRDGLAGLLRDRVLRARLAAEGPERARRFSWTRSAEALLRSLHAAARA